MSKGSPDFSSTFKIVDGQVDELDDVGRRLKERRQKRESATSSQSTKANSDSPNESGGVVPVAQKPKLGRKPPAKPKPAIIRREVRRNLTFKVLEETEQKFNRLFHQLQLAGDGRKKQDLADEAVELLFKKYGDIKLST